MSWVKSVKRIFAWRFLLRIAALLLLFCIILFLWPLPSSIQSTSYSSILFSRDGKLLAASIAPDQQWRFESTDNLPTNYKQSLLTFEDQYFYYHPGVNPVSIFRAAGNNLRAGRVTSGGSTITMQLARLLLQESDRQRAKSNPARRGFLRKAREALLAIKLEWHFDKEAILLLYANHAPYGGNIVGISAASWRYFGRPIEQLSWAEAALLAVLPNSPSMMHLGRKREALKNKRNRLLENLYQRNYLTKTDYQLALLEPLPEKPQPLPKLTPHLLQYLKKHFPEQNQFVSTINRTVQWNAQRILDQHAKRLANEGVHNISLLVIDHQTMETLAYVGNHAWQSQLHYSPQVDIIQRPRSTGSILKPILFALLLQEGKLTPTSLLPDLPSLFNGYSPENYDREYRGAVPAKNALAQSLNIPSVYMLRDYGIPHFHEKLQKMGISSLFRPADDYGLTLILGGAEASLWELTSVYARMAEVAKSGGGVKEQHPQLLMSPDSTYAMGNRSELKNVIQQGAAWLTLEALIDVARPGVDANWRDFSNSQEIAWKTGTSYGLRDAWAIGSNGRYTIGVWAGNAGGEPATFLSGTQTAAPILFDMFNSLPKTSWFDKPEHALKTISVCKDDGFLAVNQCDAMDIQIPVESHFDKTTPYHRLIHLDKNAQYRVHGDCESVAKMRLHFWFVLPPAQEFYWRQQHMDYKSLPAWRKDCLQNALAYDEDQPIDIIYPYKSSKIYIPMDIDGRLGRLIVKAVHRNANEVLYWHLDDQYMGETRVFHDKSLLMEPGKHRITLVDKAGHQLTRVITVLDRH